VIAVKINNVDCNQRGDGEDNYKDRQYDGEGELVFLFERRLVTADSRYGISRSFPSQTKLLFVFVLSVIAVHALQRLSYVCILIIFE